MAGDAISIARTSIEQCIELHRTLLEPDRLATLSGAARLIARSLSSGGKLLLFGNGGSASDASHAAAEFVGRFIGERRALPAVSLTSDHCAVTAIANDYGFDRVFARQLEALGAPGDVALAISTSGRSPNVLAGARAAATMGLGTIGLTGAGGGDLAEIVDICLTVPAQLTPRVQEAHILILHVLCELVEHELR